MEYMFPFFTYTNKRMESKDSQNINFILEKSKALRALTSHKVLLQGIIFHHS